MTSLQGTEYVNVISKMFHGSIVSQSMLESHDVFMNEYVIEYPTLRSAICALESFTESRDELDKMLGTPAFTGYLNGSSMMLPGESVTITIVEDFS